ncbi:MAG: Tfp pilus assembly protein FimT/FimU [bacterium]
MKNSGYAIIELICVLGIISILAIFSVFHLREDKLKGAAKMIYYDLQYARMAAIKEKSKFIVTFNNHDDTYNICNQESGQSIVSKDIRKEFKGIQFNANKTTATFTPIGTTDGDTGTITIEDGSHSKKKVIFTSEGRVSIEHETDNE